MSEYQYYEFQAIDRPLTQEEMEELRAYSTRARITRTSFVNDYSWGRFKGGSGKAGGSAQALPLANGPTIGKLALAAATRTHSPLRRSCPRSSRGQAPPANAGVLARLSGERGRGPQTRFIAFGNPTLVLRRFAFAGRGVESDGGSGL